MSDAETIATIKSNLLAKLEELSANPQPTYNVDGQQVNWQEFYDSLWAQVQKCDAQLAAEEPIEVISQIDTY